MAKYRGIIEETYDRRYDASLGKIDPKQIYRKLNGEHGASMKTILAIAKGLNVEPKILFDFDLYA